MNSLQGQVPRADEAADRLDSWKEIAAYLDRDVRTALRWEKAFGLPVRRVQNSGSGTVYAYRRELDAWREARARQSRRKPDVSEAVLVTPSPEPINSGPKNLARTEVSHDPGVLQNRSNRFSAQTALACCLTGIVIFTAYRVLRPDTTPVRSRTPEALENYRLGRHFWSQRTPEALRQAERHFRSAIRTDPAYAEAYAGLADTYNVMSGYDVLSPQEAFPKAKWAALRALELRESLPDAHASLGYTLAAYDRDWAGSEREFQRAINLEPGYALAHHWYSACLSIMGRHADAINEIRRARALDPQSKSIGAGVGWAFYIARSPREAVRELEKVTNSGTGFAWAHYWLGFALLQVGKQEEAMSAFRKGMNLSGGAPTYLAGLGYAYAVSGRRTAARQVLDQLDQIRTRRHVLPSSAAIVLAGLGDAGGACAWLDRAAVEYDDNVDSLNVDPIFDGIRSNRRCQEVLRYIGLGSGTGTGAHDQQSQLSNSH